MASVDYMINQVRSHNNLNNNPASIATSLSIVHNVAAHWHWNSLIRILIDAKEK
jgi:hypothetical protein